MNKFSALKWHHIDENMHDAIAGPMRRHDLKPETGYRFISWEITQHAPGSLRPGIKSLLAINAAYYDEEEDNYFLDSDFATWYTQQQSMKKSSAKTWAKIAIERATTNPANNVHICNVDRLQFDIDRLGNLTAKYTPEGQNWPQYSGIYKCEHCNRYFTAPRYRNTCGQSCRTAAFRKTHRKTSKQSWKTRQKAARKAAATKATQRHECTCENCSQVFFRDGNSAGRAKYCKPACKQEAYRKRKAAGEKRTGRQILIDDCVSVLGTSNIIPINQLEKDIRKIALDRGGKALQYYQKTQANRSALNKLERHIMLEVAQARGMF